MSNITFEMTDLTLGGTFSGDFATEQNLFLTGSGLQLADNQLSFDLQNTGEYLFNNKQDKLTLGPLDLSKIRASIERITNYPGTSAWPQGKVFMSGEGENATLFTFFSESPSTTSTDSAICMVNRQVGSSQGQWSPSLEVLGPSKAGINGDSFSSYGINSGISGLFWAITIQSDPTHPVPLTLTGNNLYIQVSSDAGKSWTKSPVAVTGLPVDAITNPCALTFDGSGHMRVGLRCFTAPNDGRIMHVKWAEPFNKPNEYTIHDIITTGEAVASGWTGNNRYTEPQIIYDPISSGFVGWLRTNSSAKAPLFCYSPDGITWNKTQPVFTDEIYKNCINSPLAITSIGEDFWSSFVHRYGGCEVYLMKGKANEVITSGASAFSVTQIGNLAGFDADSSYISSAPVGNLGMTSNSGTIYIITDGYTIRCDNNKKYQEAALYCITIDTAPKNPSILFDSSNIRAINEQQKRVITVNPNKFWNGTKIRPNATYNLEQEGVNANIYLQPFGNFMDEAVFVNSTATSTYTFQIASQSPCKMVTPNGFVLSGQNYYMTLSGYGITKLRKIQSNYDSGLHTYLIDTNVTNLPNVPNNTDVTVFPLRAAQGRVVFLENNATSLVGGTYITKDGIRPGTAGRVFGNYGFGGGFNLDFGTVGAGQSVSITGQSVAGALTSARNATIVYPMVCQGMLMHATVTASDICTVTAYNPTTGSITAGTNSFMVCSLHSP